VLYATEPLDEIMMESLRSYKEKDIVDAAKENLKLDDDDEDSKKKKEKLNEDFKGVREYLETLLKGNVQKVQVTDLLQDSPAALVQGAYGMSPTMQRYMKAQAVASGQDESGLGAMNQAVLEINPNHPIVKDLDRLVKEDKDSAELKNSALLMYDVASMTSGYTVEDMKGFAKRVMSLMSGNVKPDDADEAEPQVKDAEVVAEVVDDDEITSD
jgi:heat shock protein beta